MPKATPTSNAAKSTAKNHPRSHKSTLSRLAGQTEKTSTRGVRRPASPTQSEGSSTLHEHPQVSAESSTQHVVCPQHTASPEETVARIAAFLRTVSTGNHNGIAASGRSNGEGSLFKGRNTIIATNSESASNTAEFISRLGESGEPQQSSARTQIATEDIQSGDGAAWSTAQATGTSSPDSESINNRRNPSKTPFSNPYTEKMRQEYPYSQQERAQVPPEDSTSITENESTYQGSSRTVTLWELAARNSPNATSVASEDVALASSVHSLYSPVQCMCKDAPWNPAMPCSCHHPVHPTASDLEHQQVSNTLSLPLNIEVQGAPDPSQTSSITQPAPQQAYLQNPSDSDSDIPPSSSSSLPTPSSHPTPTFTSVEVPGPPPTEETARRVWWLVGHASAMDFFEGIEQLEADQW